MTKIFYALLLLASLAFIGTGATAAAAGSSAPGGALYSVKLGMEDLQMDLTRTPKEQVDLALGQAGERMDEITALLDAGETIPEQSYTRLAYHLNYALNLAAGQQDADFEAAVNHIHQRIQDQDRTMAKWQDGTPGVGDPAAERVRSMLRERLQALEDGLLDAEGFRATVQQRYRLENSAGAGPQVGVSIPVGTIAGALGPGTPAGDGAPYGPGDCAATCTPVQDGTGPGYGPGPMGTPNSYGPGPSTSATPAQGGTGPGPGPMSTPAGGGNQSPDPSCTPVQDGSGPGPGPVGTPEPPGGGRP